MDIFYGLDDFLKLFIAYKNPQDVFEYVLELRNDKCKPVLHIKPNGGDEKIGVKESVPEWVTAQSWQEIEATDIHPYVKSAGGALCNFLLSQKCREQIMSEDDWLKLLAQAASNRANENKQKEK